MQKDEYFLTLVRYVERNAKRAGLVKNAEDWKWSSISARLRGNDKQKKLLSPWPVEEPDDYRFWVNQSESKEEIENIVIWGHHTYFLTIKTPEVRLPKEYLLIWKFNFHS